MPADLLSSALSIAAKNYPDKIAVIDLNNGDKFTFGELDTKVNRVVAGLRKMGIQKGDGVSLFTTASVDVMVYCWATWRLGASLSIIRPILLANIAQFIQEENNVKVTLTDPSRASKVRGPLIMVGELPQEDNAEPYYDDSISPDDRAAVLYTSGSTGRVKGAIITRQQLILSAEGHVEGVKLTKDDVSLVQMDISGGFVTRNQLLACTFAGATMIIMNKQDPNSPLTEIENYPITLLYQTPTIAYNLMQLAKAKCEKDGCKPIKSKLRGAIISCDKVLLSLHAGYEEYLNIPIAEGMGMSEMGTYSYNPLTGMRKPGSAGPPVSNIKVRIHEPDVNGIGEIVLSGPSISHGYLNLPEINRQVYVNGEMFTGDLGRLDSDGFLWYEGRIKNIIKRMGRIIYPKEVEDPLETHPAVARATIVGAADDRLGQKIVAFVILKDNATATSDDLISFLSSLLDIGNRPDEIIFVSKFPLNATAKVDRIELQQFAEGKIHLDI